MVKKEAGDYRNQLGILYNSINIIERVGEDFHRKYNKISPREYIFSNVPLMPYFENHYSFSELKEIMSVTPKKNLKEANSLIKKINLELSMESEDILKFTSLMNDICICLDGRPIK